MTSGDILAEAWGEHWKQEYEEKKAEQERIAKELIKGLKIAIPGLIDCTGLTSDEEDNDILVS